MTRRTGRIARGATIAVVAGVLAAASVGLAQTVPGPTLEAAPFTVVGVGAATSGPLTVEVHGTTLAESIVVEEETRSTTGVFVLLDVTIASREQMDVMSRELVVDGRTFSTSWRGPGFQEGTPAPGLPVRGQVVFEVDAELVAEGTWIELHVAPGLNPAGDLQPQAAVRTQLPGTVESSVVVEVLSR